MSPLQIAPFAIAAALLASSGARAASFTFTDLDVPGYASTRVSGLPYALNNSDQVVGTTQQSKTTMPEGFSWKAGTFSFYPGVRNLPAVNDSGIAAGQPLLVSGYALVDTNNGGVETFPGTADGVPVAINDANQVAAQGKNVGYLLDGASRTVLRVPHARTTTPTGINAGGIVVGSYDSDSGDGGFTYLNGTYKEFVVPGSLNVNPVFILDNGVIGGSFTSGQAFTLVGFIKRGNKYFGYAPANAMASTVTGIGPHGEIVGHWEDPTGGIHARGFVLIDGTYYNIDYPGAAGTYVEGVNTRGSLIGEWYDSNFVNHPFIAQCPHGQTCTQ